MLVLRENIVVCVVSIFGQSCDLMYLVTMMFVFQHLRKRGWVQPLVSWARGFWIRTIRQESCNFTTQVWIAIGYGKLKVTSNSLIPVMAGIDKKDGWGRWIRPCWPEFSILYIFLKKFQCLYSTLSMC